jgi:hypothetical protein
MHILSRESLTQGWCGATDMHDVFAGFVAAHRTVGGIPFEEEPGTPQGTLKALRFAGVAHLTPHLPYRRTQGISL